MCGLSGKYIDIVKQSEPHLRSQESQELQGSSCCMNVVSRKRDKKKESFTMEINTCTQASAA